ncbi:MAG TPA: RNA polymerase sigma factor [Solirubrobacteraceae bacterium]|nr:RNA polymerase sigma factor [Solirubrobacteraceae bacterium]
MRRTQAHDAQAFALLYARHRGRALRVAHATCHDPDRAQEAVQEAFMSMWAKRATYRPALGEASSGALQRWMMTIVHHRTVDLARRNGRVEYRRAEVEELDVLRRGLIELEDYAIGDLEAKDLRERMRRLPPDQREVIALAFWVGLSHTQIAELLSLPPGTVKGRIRLGLKKLRLAIESPDDQPGERAYHGLAVSSDPSTP